MDTVIRGKRTISPLAFDVFGGLDVDGKKIVARFLDFHDRGLAITLPNDAANLLAFTGTHFEGKKVAFVYEAGPTGFALYDALAAAGQQCLVVAPSMIPVAPGNRVKTNRRDANQLARQLRGGELEGIRVPVGAYRELRQLTSLRNMHARNQRAYKCRVKALITNQGLVYPDHKRGCAWTQETLGKVSELPYTPAARFRLTDLLECLQREHQNVLRSGAEIRRFCRRDADLAESVRYLRSVPGVGWAISTHFLARVGDWRCIANGEEVADFVGLVPAEDSTGDRIRRGGITHKGDREMRRMIIQGAWVAIQKDAQLREFFERVAARHPKQIARQVAIVAAARKLVLRMVAVLTQGREYEVK